MQQVGCSILGMGIRWTAASARVLLPFVLERARNIGFSAIELPVPDMRAEQLQRLVEGVLPTDAIRAVHAPKQILSLSADLMIDAWAATCEFARALGASIVVVHPPAENPNPRLADCIARKAGELTVAYENVNDYVFSWVSASTGRCNCGITLDISHAQYAGAPLERYFCSNVVHTHVRGYHPQAKYHRLQNPDPGLLTLLHLSRQHDYSGLLLLEYPYQTWGQAAADYDLVLQHINSLAPPQR